jgi:hypothetical protein
MTQMSEVESQLAGGVGVYGHSHYALTVFRPLSFPKGISFSL